MGEGRDLWGIEPGMLKLLGKLTDAIEPMITERDERIAALTAEVERLRAEIDRLRPKTVKRIVGRNDRRSPDSNPGGA